MDTIGLREPLIIRMAVFGPNRLPKIARDVGEGIREFRQAPGDADSVTEPQREKPARTRPAVEAWAAQQPRRDR
jgi:TatA/E family protein of Tat protein translocase